MIRSCGAVAVGDLNGDGLLGVVFQHTEGWMAAWFMDGADTDQQEPALSAGFGDRLESGGDTLKAAHPKSRRTSAAGVVRSGLSSPSSNRTWRFPPAGSRSISSIIRV